MAEFGDALSTAILSQKEDVSKPSIFEVLAQSSLHATVRPAINHVIKVLAENYPQQLGWSQRWFHEWYTALECVIQHYFLSAYSASFAEYYYDLKRIPLKPTTDYSNLFPLGRRLHYLSIATLSIFPYVEVKLADFYSKTKEKRFNHGFKELSLSEKSLLICYPYIHMLWNMTILYYNFSYAIGKSDFHFSLYKILNVKLGYLNPLESDDSNNTSMFGLVTKLLSGSVSAGVFAIQFMEWWFNENNHNSLKEVMKNPTPSPPSDLLLNTNLPVPSNDICPLCNRKRKNDTALLTSGYVYCYVCIFKYVKAHQRCPVTGYRSGTNHLVKIYPPT